MYIGKGDGRVKIYNKKRESDLAITGVMTRVEVSRQVDDFRIYEAKYLDYDGIFPNIYLANYVYSLSDYSKDKTLMALLYAVQSGYPMKELSRSYRCKVKELLEGGYKLKFDKECVRHVLRQTLYAYFVRFGSLQVIH